MTRLIRRGGALVLLPILVVAGSMPRQSLGAQALTDPTRDDYLAAARLLHPNVRGLVLNETVQPHWIGQTGRFWYQREGQNGQEWVVVAAKGRKTLVLDHGGLVKVLRSATGGETSNIDPAASVTNVVLSDDLTQLAGVLGQKSVSCNLQAQQCRLADPVHATPELLLSPDARQGVLLRDDNLFLRDLATGQERALTSDGVPTLSWANEPFYASFITWSRVRSGAKSPPWQTAWSPDGRYFIAPLVDVRGVGLYPYVEMVPVDGSKRPVVHNVPMPMPGDRETVKITYFIFDLSSGRRTAVQLPPDYPELSWPGSWAPVVGWSRKRGQAFILARTVGWKKGALFRVDLASGSASKVIEESSPTRVEFHAFWGPANVRILGDGAEAIWYSDRTGWGHLYLYDAQTGRLKNAITRGEWPVGDIEAIDERHREVYLTATGKEPDKDLYYRHLYRARLDGRSDLVRLTQADADHNFGPVRAGGLGRPAESGEVGSSPLIDVASGEFIDTWSTVDRPPISEVRSLRDGHVIAELERADASRLFAAGWRPPVRERVKAADGKTDVLADYFAPQPLTAGSKYPLIDNPYNGPGSLRTPRNFTEAYSVSSSTGASALTRLGFGLVIVDGRGTASRSREFRDAAYPNFVQVGVDDHVAAIRQLAGRHAEIDLDRVGVYGQSWGGSFAAQAILSRPEFYKVAIASAGEYDYSAIETGYEEYIGEPIYADGSHFRTRPDEEPENWRQTDIVRMADRLQGYLLITQGDMDEESRPNQTARLIDALIRANKPFDYLYLPEGEHSAYFTSYGFKRGWDYFIEHLRGARPVREFNIGLPGNIR